MRAVLPFSLAVILVAGCPSPEGTDAGSDVPMRDAGGDAPADAGRRDAGADAPMDVPTAMDTPMDVPTAMDVPADAPTTMDVPMDVPAMMDVPVDTAMVDVPVDTSMVDVPIDAPVDTGTDAPVDTGADVPLDSPDAPRCSVDRDCPTDLTCLPTMSCGCPVLDPMADLMGRTPDIVMTELVPGAGGYIELYNTTSSPITLPGTYQLCSPVTYAGLGSGTIPARSYITIPWPATFVDTLAGGEVILYRDSFFATPASVMDFVCWGTNPHATRQGTAFTAGRWNTTTGGCAPAITGGAIHRRPMTDGIDAADYDTTSPPSAVSCTP